MDENENMNFRNWRILEAPSLKSCLDLQLMPSISEKPLIGTSPSPAIGGLFQHHRGGGISEPHASIENWMNSNHPYYQSILGYSPGTSSARSVQIRSHVILTENENAVSELNESCGERDSYIVAKKRASHDNKVQHPAPKEKKPRIRAPRTEPSCPPAHRARPPKKRAEIEINGSCMDISDIPTPVCSCTGSSQQCYRWGSGGWQSACCTMGMSVYPLPMSTKRPGARIAGRKMSIGAFKKVLEKLTNEGYDFSSPIDLRSYWAKHGTNKFVTIR